MCVYVLHLCNPPSSVNSENSEQNFLIVKAIQSYLVLKEIFPRRQCEFIMRVQCLYLFCGSQFHAFYLLGTQQHTMCVDIG